MTPIRRLFLGLGLILLVLVAVAFALPRQVSVARTIVVDAPESDVFPYLNDPRRFNQWSPWASRAANTQYTFSGPEAGEGARMTWHSDHPQIGRGAQQIVESRKNALVKTKLEFADMGAADASYRLAPAGAGTRVTWAVNTDVGNNPVMRWSGLLFARAIGADMDQGLVRLKRHVESN